MYELQKYTGSKPTYCFIQVTQKRPRGYSTGRARTKMDAGIPCRKDIFYFCIDCDISETQMSTREADMRRRKCHSWVQVVIDTRVRSTLQMDLDISETIVISQKPKCLPERQT